MSVIVCMLYSVVNYRGSAAAAALTMNIMMVMMMKRTVAEWLLEAYRTQWLSMLRVDSGTDIGSVSCCRFLISHCLGCILSLRISLFSSHLLVRY